MFVLGTTNSVPKSCFCQFCHEQRHVRERLAIKEQQPEWLAVSINGDISGDLNPRGWLKVLPDVSDRIDIEQCKQLPQLIA